MHQVQLELTDEVYEQVKRRAAQAGFTSVDEYAAGVLTSDALDDDEHLDRLFTPERLAHIDNVIAKVNTGGQTHTMEEVRENLARNRADWIQRNGR